MKRIVLFVALLGASLAALAQEDLQVVLAAATVAAPSTNSPRQGVNLTYRARVGDTCTYSWREFAKEFPPFVETVTEAKAGVYSADLTRNGRRFGAVIRDSVGNEVSRQIGTTWYHYLDRRYLNPPHVLGKSWAITMVGFDPKRGSATTGRREVIRQNVSVKGFETVIVQSKTITAVRIVAAGFFEYYTNDGVLMGSGSLEDEMWYSEETGCVVKWTRNRRAYGDQLDFTTSSLLDFSTRLADQD